MTRIFSRFGGRTLLAAWAGLCLMWLLPAEAAGTCRTEVFTMPVMLDEEQVGAIEVTTCGELRTVKKADFLFLLYQDMNDTAFGRIEQEETEEGGVWKVGEPLGGGTLRYDAEHVAMLLDIPVAQRKLNKLGLRLEGDGMEGADVVAPEDISAFMNLYGAQGYGQGVGMKQGRMPARVDTDWAINYKGTVLEGTLNYVEGAAHPLMADNVRVVKDDAEAMVRYQLGELSYPITGFQGYRPLLGVGVARNFGLQPYRVTSPAGRTHFTLDTPSTVDIYVNNQRVRSLQLAKGTYELNDFPVVNGVNNVRLMITDAYGRTEEKFFPVVNDADLLDDGLWEFALSAGVPVEKVNRAKVYDTEQPVVTGFARYGLSEQMTAGVNLTADEDLQLLGFEQTLAGALGTLKTELAGSLTADKAGTALRLEYRNLLMQDATTLRTGDDLWSLLFEHQDAGFRTDSTAEDDPYGFTVQAAYSRNLLENVTASFGLAYKTGRGDSKDDRDAFVGFYWRVAAGMALNINTMYSTEDKYNLMLGLSWFPYDKRYQMNSSYDAHERSLRVDGTQSSVGFNQGLEMRAGIATGDEQDTATGAAIYNGGRGFVRVTHDVVSTLDRNGIEGGMGTQTQVQVGTAVVYAGGMAAVAKPVNNSFLILSPRASLQGAGLSINPMESADNKTVYEAKSGFLGPAVITDMMPYTYRKVQVGMLKDSDEEVLMGQSMFTVKPLYKSGTRLRVGSDALAYASGDVVDEKGMPILLASGELEGDGAGPQMIFTNRQGGFTTEALKPGKYVLTLAGYPHRAAVLEIPPKLKGQVRVGTLMLAEVRK